MSDYLIRRVVPIRTRAGLNGRNADRQRQALARWDECARLCGHSEAELDAFHAAQRARVRARLRLGATA